jgi:hypothetical protein
MDARLGDHMPLPDCRITALCAAFEAELNACCPADLSPLQALMHRLADELPARGAVRIFVQQWTIERIPNHWQDFRVATIKLFRMLRAEAAREQVEPWFALPGQRLVMGC